MEQAKHDEKIVEVSPHCSPELPLTCRPSIDWFLIGSLGLIFVGYILIHDLTGESLLEHNVYDSYSLQALSWLRGEMALPEDYSWLELAVYKGSYYVSFPPVPSVFLFPLVVLFGADTPSNLVLAVVTMASVAFCYECFRHQGTGQRSAMFWAVFYVMGSNMLWMSTKGGVWFLAQGFNLMLCTAAVWAYLAKRDVPAMLLTALAVGCRPFSVFFCGVLLVLIWSRQVQEHGVRQASIQTAKTLVLPAAVAAGMLIYNYARFDNPFEFGHNYLPEFMEAEEGQFSLTYIGQNAHNLFLIPVQLNSQLGVEIPSFDGFMFFVANPLFIVYFVLLIRDAVQRTFSRANLIVLIGFAANLFLLMMHKTLGGWQFGARYTVDLLPYALFTLLEDRVARPNKAELLLGAGAVLFNVYGIYYLIIIEGFI